MKYIFDIDGTVCYNNNGDYYNSKPMRNRIEIINKLYDQGNEIHFFTARGMSRNKGNVSKCYNQFYSLTYNQLTEWGVKFHSLILGKPSGDMYVDDKGVTDVDFFGN
tara:strand:+ start:172 stop:492 length:321 start_codon:yes stop_codon:yes gene_type:complete